MITLYEGINIRGDGSLNPSATFTSDPFPLLDAIDCVVTEERNGQFSLVLRYPIGAKYSEKIIPDAIIMATPRPNAGVEPFRIFEIEQVIEGVVTARANHLVYDLDGLSFGYPTNHFSTKAGITNTLDELTIDGQFITRCFELANDGITDTTTVVDFGSVTSVTIWQAIGAVAAAFHAEMKYEWNDATNRCKITFCAARGVAKPAIISYGVNLISLDRKLDYSQLYSRVVMVYYRGATAFPQYRQGVANTGYTGRERSLWIDVTDQYHSEPSVDTLNALAQAYVDAHDWNPSSQLTVEFVPLGNTTQYGGVSELAFVGSAVVGLSMVGDIDQVIGKTVLYLCDTATVDASLIGVTATAKCVKVAYNVITDKYNEVTVGTIQSDIVDTILSLEGK